MDIPRIGGGASQSSENIQHTVGKGDTLENIAKLHGVTSDAILQANPQLKDPSKLVPGQSLQIPQGEAEFARKLASDLYPAIGLSGQDTIERGPEQVGIVLCKTLGAGVNPCVLPNPETNAIIPCVLPSPEKVGIVLCKTPGAGVNPCYKPNPETNAIIPCILPSESHAIIPCVLPSPEKIGIIGPCNMPAGAINPCNMPAGDGDPHVRPAGLSGFANSLTLNFDKFSFNDAGHLTLKDVSLAQKFKTQDAGGEARTIGLRHGELGTPTKFQLSPDSFHFSQEGFLVIKDPQISAHFQSLASRLTPSEGNIIVDF